MNNDHVIPPRINSFYGSNKSSNQSLLVDNILSQQGPYIGDILSDVTYLSLPRIFSIIIIIIIFRFRVLAALVVCSMLTMGPCHPRTLSGALQSPATGRRGSDVASPGLRSGVRRQNVITTEMGGGHQCTEMRSQYLRSQCRDNGFLTVQRNRVLVQTTGLNTTHVEGRRNLDHKKDSLHTSFYFSSAKRFIVSYLLPSTFFSEMDVGGILYVCRKG